MPVVVRGLAFVLALALGCGGPRTAPTPGIGSSGDALFHAPPVPDNAAAQDRDGDGAEDGEDRCPDDPEDCDGFQDEDGCPDPDNDGDGIVDICDKCPNEPETFNGREDEDGCPDDKVVIIQSSIRIIQRVQFPFASATPLAASQPVIEAVAQVMKDHSFIDLVGVVGHAAPGEPDPVRLGERRARSVRVAVEHLGVDASRLEVRSLGARQPLVAPSDRRQEMNRRVEFTLIRARGADVMRWGADGYISVEPPAAPMVPPPAAHPCPDPNAPVHRTPAVRCAGKAHGGKP